MSGQIECRYALSSRSRLDRAIANIESLDLKDPSPTILRIRVHHLMQTYATVINAWEPDLPIYRVRVMGDLPRFRTQIGYPPSHLAKLGRLNWQSSPVFYGALTETGALLESNLIEGDLFCLSLWRTNDICTLEYFGYASRYVATRYGRQEAEWLGILRKERELNQLLREWIAGKFTAVVSQEKPYHYRLTAALAEASLHRHCYQVTRVQNIDGIRYPFVAWGLSGNNIALKSDYADLQLRLCDVRMRRVEKIVDGVLHCLEINSSEQILENGEIVWQGRPSRTRLGLRMPPYFRSTRYHGSEIQPGTCDRRRYVFGFRLK